MRVKTRSSPFKQYRLMRAFTKQPITHSCVIVAIKFLYLKKKKKWFLHKILIFSLAMNVLKEFLGSYFLRQCGSFKHQPFGGEFFFLLSLSVIIKIRFKALRDPVFLTQILCSIWINPKPNQNLKRKKKSFVESNQK